ncbi:MAG: DUF2189 domain-containing protein [Hyphomicrobiales bacterium]|uniref:DUF2189 domain-containing protein n=1 Tax=Rhabdaerophilum calidifontis TaxID=2604328 RepID=UPI00123A19F6|nr:DUF2189 domain-containing protein [Rhabdaerophilum calidifontis]MCA1952999.1 DUF2189 domain-containing protein [Hyphomicrobiales bacterium]MCA1999561.1 DUF2189 domain-containing protein [Hyphomicrobiales bacterium]
MNPGSEIDLPLPRAEPVPSAYARPWVTRAAPRAWLAAGWRDLRHDPASSLAYGVLVWLASLGLILFVVRHGRDYILFPLLAGFLVVGPLVALGLYEKSRRLAAGETAGLWRMVFLHPASGAQILFTGALLCLLMLAWMRAAVLIYALFFGLRPFPGLDQIAPMLFTTPTGWAMLFVGSAIGALFAAFSFAISVFALPMQLTERVDALTAMGSSMSLVWRNLPVMLLWGGIVLALFLAAVATALLGLIVVFPLLGHATWHAYETMRAPAPDGRETVAP